MTGPSLRQLIETLKARVMFGRQQEVEYWARIPMVLHHYQLSKTALVSFSPKALASPRVGSCYRSRSTQWGSLSNLRWRRRCSSARSASLAARSGGYSNWMTRLLEDLKFELVHVRRLAVAQGDEVLIWADNRSSPFMSTSCIRCRTCTSSGDRTFGAEITASHEPRRLRVNAGS